MTEFFIWIILAAVLICLGFELATLENYAMAWTCIGGSLCAVIIAGISAIYP